MDATSGVGSRGMPMTNNGRPRDFAGGVPLNGPEGERQSHSGLGQGFGTTTGGWGGSIWNSNNTLGSGFASGTRDNTRPRGSFAATSTIAQEPSAFLGAVNSNSFEGKTGSGSLVSSSESDSWTMNRNPWDNPAGNKSHARSSGVSPARKRSLAQAQPGQQFGETSSSTYFPISRTTGLNTGPLSKPTKPTLDPTIGNFTSTRPVDPLISTSFNNFQFQQPDASLQRNEGTVGSWPDTASVHSPNDDRRSVANSDFFPPSSSTPSRSGSLPPSRHGEAAPITQSAAADHYNRFIQANPRHASFSHANGRGYQERSGSIQSDSLQMLGRLNLDQEHEGTVSHRPSVSINSSAFNPSGNELPFSRDNFAETQGLLRNDEQAFSTANGYTPETFSNGLGDTGSQFGTFRLDSRSAPNGSATRQSPFYSQTHTPPPAVFDHLYPSRTDQTLSNGNNIALVHSKLAGYQQQQERRNFANPSQFHQQQFQHLLGVNQNQLRNPYGYAYTMPNGVPMNTIPPNISMSMIPQMVAVMEPPKAPREHHQQTGEALMSKCLWDYRQSSKNGSRRFELKDIYDHVVEFSGDQHGSRFIQSKLEIANSDEKERVFRELQSDSLQLMQDVFGNYVIQKFFEHGDQTQKRILANRMKGHVYHLSMQMYGCRVVQKALEHILTDQQALLVKELEKDVLACVKDQNGNHVVQKAIERVPFEHIQFIVDAFKGQVGALSVNGYGCRVIQRMLEFVPEPARRFILEELRAEGSKLITDQYGNYVAQHVIEHGTSDDSENFISLVTKDILLYSKHKFASNVVERCLVCGTNPQRRAIMLKVTAKNEHGESNLKMLVKDNYGNYVIQKILETLHRPDYEELVAILQPVMEDAKKIISGKQVIQIEKKLHRFDRIDSVSSPTPKRSSMSSAIEDVPALTSESQSPQSTSVPSANLSTVDEPVHSNTLNANKTLTTPGVLNIANAS